MSTLLSSLSEALGSDAQAQAAIEAIKLHGLVCVPLEPSDKMIDAAWASALAENAAGVWSAMIEEFLTPE